VIVDAASAVVESEPEDRLIATVVPSGVCATDQKLLDAGALNAPVPLRNVPADPAPDPNRAAGIVPDVALPKAVTMLLPVVALLVVIDNASEPAELVTSPLCAGSAEVGSVVTGFVGEKGTLPVM
jgi:hypothetical protein